MRRSHVAPSYSIWWDRQLTLAAAGRRGRRSTRASTSSSSLGILRRRGKARNSATPSMGTGTTAEGFRCLGPRFRRTTASATSRVWGSDQLRCLVPALVPPPLTMTTLSLLNSLPTGSFSSICFIIILIFLIQVCEFCVSAMFSLVFDVWSIDPFLERVYCNHWSDTLSLSTADSL